MTEKRSPKLQALHEKLLILCEAKNRAAREWEAALADYVRKEYKELQKKKTLTKKESK